MSVTAFITVKDFSQCLSVTGRSHQTIDSRSPSDMFLNPAESWSTTRLPTSHSTAPLGKPCNCSYRTPLLLISYSIQNAEKRISLKNKHSLNKAVLWFRQSTIQNTKQTVGLCSGRRRQI